MKWNTEALIPKSDMRHFPIFKDNLKIIDEKYEKNGKEFIKNLNKKHVIFKKDIWIHS